MLVIVQEILASLPPAAWVDAGVLSRRRTLWQAKRAAERPRTFVLVIVFGFRYLRLGVRCWRFRCCRGVDRFGRLGRSGLSGRLR
jgi:hypothetical protein